MKFSHEKIKIVFFFQNDFEIVWSRLCKTMHAISIKIAGPERVNVVRWGLRESSESLRSNSRDHLFTYVTRSIFTNEFANAPFLLQRHVY